MIRFALFSVILTFSADITAFAQRDDVGSGRALYFDGVNDR